VILAGCVKNIDFPEVSVACVAGFRLSKRIAGSTLPASTANRGVDAMSVLSKLKIVALPPKSGLTPEQQRRAKVIVKLQE